MSDASRSPGERADHEFEASARSTDGEPSLSDLAIEVESIRARVASRLNELERCLMSDSLIDCFTQPTQEKGPDMLNNLNERMRDYPIAAAVAAIDLTWLIGSATRGTGPSRPAHCVGGEAPQLVDDQSLAIGALVVAVGAIIGSVLPLSDREDRWLGERKATLLDEANQAMHDRLKQARETVKDHVRQVRTDVTNDLTGRR